MAATVVFSGAGYLREARAARPGAPAPRRRVATVVALVAVLVVAVPMVANTVQAALADLWLGQTRAAAEDWLSGTDDASVDAVRWEGQDLVVEVRSPGDLPDVATLQAQVDELVPWDPQVVVVHTVGERVAPEG